MNMNSREDDKLFAHIVSLVPKSDTSSKSNFFKDLDILNNPNSDLYYYFDQMKKYIKIAVMGIKHVIDQSQKR